MFGLNHITIAGNDQRSVFVGDGEHGFKTAEAAVGAPVFGQFDGSAYQMALVFFQLAFKTLKQGESVGGSSGETGQHFTVIQTADFFGIAFHNGIAQGNLAIAAHDDFAVAADGYDCGQGSVSGCC